MKAIPLTKGYTAIVDDQDYESLSQYSWCSLVTGKNAYAVRYEGDKNNRRIIYMHREILNADPSQIVDHINGNGLRNTRDNLRLADKVQNRRNSRKGSYTRPLSSQYKGVHKRNKGTLRWVAKITENGKPLWIDYFSTEIEAAMAYNEKAKEYFGEFAVVNTIGETEIE